MSSKPVPKFDFEKIDPSTYLVTIEGERFECECRGKTFRIKNGHGLWSQEMTCCGNPVLDPQGPDVPPAAIIAYLKGSKPDPRTWSNHWRHNPPSHYI